MAEHRLDLERRQRLGLVEAVWGEHKSAEQIIAIARDFQAAGELCLITRVDGAKASAVRAAIPEVEHHQQARCLTLGAMPTPTTPAVGLLCGGSSDLTVLAEAELALHCHGISAKRFADVGVAGLHRLLKVLPQLGPLKVAFTAGASTPDTILGRVIRRVAELAGESLPESQLTV